MPLTTKMRELFEDATEGAFFSTAAGDSSLVLRMKDDYDGAEPSGNSVALIDLLRLAHFTDRADYREAAERTLGALGVEDRSAGRGHAADAGWARLRAGDRDARWCLQAMPKSFCGMCARDFLPHTVTLRSGARIFSSGGKHARDRRQTYRLRLPKLCLSTAGERGCRSWTSCYNRSKFNQTNLRRMHGKTWSHDDERKSADAAWAGVEGRRQGTRFNAVNDGLQPVNLAGTGK